MSSEIEETSPTAKDRLTGAVLLSACLGLLWVYAEAQLGYTVRFLFEIWVYLDRIL